MTDRPVAGTIRISDEVLADLAGYAALQTFGVVGMASPTVRDGVAQLLSRERLRKGIRVSGDDLERRLGTLANLLDDYHQSVVGKADYFRVFKTYTLDQRWQGRPYIAESANPVMAKALVVRLFGLYGLSDCTMVPLI